MNQVKDLAGRPNARREAKKGSVYEQNQPARLTEVIMRKTSFETPFQLSFTSMNIAAILDAAGFYVEVLRQAASKRCVFYVDDVKAVRDLIGLYHSGDVVPVSGKRLLASRSVIHQRCLRALMEAI